MKNLNTGKYRFQDWKNGIIPVSVLTIHKYTLNSAKAWAQHLCSLNFPAILEIYTMCPDDMATAGSWAGVGLGQLRFGFVAVLERHILRSVFFPVYLCLPFLHFIVAVIQNNKNGHLYIKGDTVAQWGK
jgi:hypothetical protein